jgi:hypothetical protein
LQERALREAQAASRDRAEAVAAEMDAMRENALAAALAEARHSLAALQRQHEAGQRSLAELQVGSCTLCSLHDLEAVTTQPIALVASMKNAPVSLKKAAAVHGISSTWPLNHLRNRCFICISHLTSQLSSWSPSLATAAKTVTQRCCFVQARSEEESLGLQTQLEVAGTEVERAHARLAALELERERSAAQVRRIAWICQLKGHQ